MLRKTVFLSAAISLLWLLPLIISPNTSNATSQVKGIQTSSVTFEHSLNTPDPNEIFALVNQARRSEGLPVLRANEQLTGVARQRAEDMASNHYYAHQNKEGKYYYDLMEQQGIVTAYSCENLDIEFSHLALTYITDWLGSTQGHKQCLLNQQVTEAGYAVVELDSQKSSDTNTYIVVAIHATEPKQQ